MDALAGILMATAPFGAVGGLLWWAARVRTRQAECIARQIALTDAIHRELGAVAAPVVERRRTGGWVVVLGVPLDRGDLVGRLVGIAHRLFASLDRTSAPRLQVVLTPREPVPAGGTSLVVRPAAGHVARALAQVGARLP